MAVAVAAKAAAQVVAAARCLPISDTEELVTLMWHVAVTATAVVIVVGSSIRSSRNLIVTTTALVVEKEKKTRNRQFISESSYYLRKIANCRIGQVKCEL